MKRKFGGNGYIVFGLLMAVGVLAFVLYPANPGPQPAVATEIPGTVGPVVTARFVETTTRFVDGPPPVADRPAPVVAAPVPVVTRTEPAEENTTIIIFQQPDDAVAEAPRVVNTVMAANETYRIERQVAKAMPMIGLD